MDELMDREIRVIIEALQRFAPTTLGADRAAAERAISVFQRETENREHGGKMTAITKITIPCTNDTMGETSPADCDAYRAWLANMLSSDYPGAYVIVTEQPGRIEVETDDGSETTDLVSDLHQLQNHYWDSCTWDFV